MLTGQGQSFPQMMKVVLIQCLVALAVVSALKVSVPFLEDKQIVVEVEDPSKTKLSKFRERLKQELLKDPANEKMAKLADLVPLCNPETNLPLNALGDINNWENYFKDLIFSDAQVTLPTAYFAFKPFRADKPLILMGCSAMKPEDVLNHYNPKDSEVPLYRFVKTDKPAQAVYKTYKDAEAGSKVMILRSSDCTFSLQYSKEQKVSVVFTCFPAETKVFELQEAVQSSLKGKGVDPALIRSMPVCKAMPNGASALLRDPSMTLKQAFSSADPDLQLAAPKLIRISVGDGKPFDVPVCSDMTVDDLKSQIRLFLGLDASIEVTFDTVMILDMASPLEKVNLQKLLFDFGQTPKLRLAITTGQPPRPSFQMAPILAKGKTFFTDRRTLLILLVVFLGVGMAAIAFTIKDDEAPGMTTQDSQFVKEDQFQPPIDHTQMASPLPDGQSAEINLTSPEPVHVEPVDIELPGEKDLPVPADEVIVEQVKGTSEHPLPTPSDHDDTDVHQ